MFHSAHEIVGPVDRDGKTELFAGGKNRIHRGCDGLAIACIGCVQIARAGPKDGADVSLAERADNLANVFDTQLILDDEYRDQAPGGVELPNVPALIV